MAKSEVLLAFNELMEARGLPPEMVMEAIKAALISAYRKAVGAPSAQPVEVELDLEKGKIQVFAEKEVVEEVQDERTEVSLEEARRWDPEAQLGSVVMVEVTPTDFGRVAAQTARQVIQQRLREAERRNQYEYFKKLEGEIINGIVQAITPQEVTLGLEKNAEGHLPRREQIPRDHFRIHDRVRALVLDVKETPRGPYILLSRAHKDFLRRLLEEEVPEIYRGEVEIRAIAREAGLRSKVAVSAIAPNIDPVGACVGMRGVRIQSIMRELNGEKIDIIQWDPDPAVFIAKALSPARVLGVYLSEPEEGPRTATVVVSEDQLSLAIGRDGQNARLAAKLTSWRIDIKGVAEAAADALYKLQTNPEYAKVAAAEAEAMAEVEAILAKQAEGRPLSPEEYRTLAAFVDRVEGQALAKIEEAKQRQAAKMKALRATIPDEAFELPVDVLGLSPRLTIALTNAGYATVGDLMMQLKLDPDEVLALSGVGPKVMERIVEGLRLLELPVDDIVARLSGEELVLPEPEPESPAEAEAEAEPSALEEVPPVAEAEEVPEPVEVADEAPAAPSEETAPEAEEAEEAEEEVPLEEIFSSVEVPDEVFMADEEEEAEPEPKEKPKKKKKKKKKSRYYEEPEEEEWLRSVRRRGGEDWDEWL